MSKENMQKILELEISQSSWIQKLSFVGQNHSWLGQIVLAKQRMEVIRFPLKYWLFYSSHGNMQLYEKFLLGYQLYLWRGRHMKKYANINWL